MPSDRLRRVIAAAGFCIPLTLVGLSASAGPPAPTVLFPAGGGPGQTVTVTAAGTFDAWPVQVWTNDSNLQVEPNEDKGSFRIQIADGTPPGIRWIRCYDATGASSLLPFEVAPHPGVVEEEPNDAPADAGVIETLPAVVDGRLAKSGDVDGYAVTLSKGQTLVASLAGHRLGSPMDAVLQIVSPEGFVLQQNDDEAGLDPQLRFDVPADGVYIVRCFAFPADPNSTIGFSGSERYVYRLTLTVGGFLDHTLPLTVAADSDVTVEPRGVNLPDGLTALSADVSPETDRALVWHPDLAGYAVLPVLPFPCIRATEAAGSEEGQTVTPPVSISGTMATPGQRDTFRLTARKGEVLRFGLLAGGLHSPLNPVLRITDAAGKVVVEKDATGRGGRDVEHRLSVPEDGDYTVAVFDLAERAGERQFYRLDVATLHPDYHLTLAADRVTVVSGESATVDVSLVRTNGFDASVELSVDGLPAGIEAAAVRNEPDADAKPDASGAVTSTVTLTLTTGDDAAAWSGPIRLVGRADVDGGESTERLAAFALPISGESTTALWLTVTSPAE